MPSVSVAIISLSLGEAICGALHVGQFANDTSEMPRLLIVIMKSNVFCMQFVSVNVLSGC